MNNKRVFRFFLYFLFSLTVIGFFILILIEIGVYIERKRHIPKITLLNDYNNNSERQKQITDIRV